MSDNNHWSVPVWQQTTFVLPSCHTFRGSEAGFGQGNTRPNMASEIKVKSRIRGGKGASVWGSPTKLLHALFLGHSVSDLFGGNPFWLFSILQCISEEEC